MQYYGTRLSENISRREPEGYLLCLNVPVARTGTQEYLPEELDLPSGSSFIPVFRPEEEVFSPETIASFEGMPVTNDHPAEEVSAENIRSLQKGHAHNIRRGSGEESDLLLADLIITDPELIEAVLSGKREISCGYTYELCEENGQYIQRKIRGNHVAVVDAGRAGPRVCIKDEHPVQISDLGEPPATASGGCFAGGEVRRNKRAPLRGVAPIESAEYRCHATGTRDWRAAGDDMMMSQRFSAETNHIQRRAAVTIARNKPELRERSTHMKKSLVKKLVRMAKDGDPEAIEALAEMLETATEVADPDTEVVVVETQRGEAPGAAGGGNSAGAEVIRNEQAPRCGAATIENAETTIVVDGDVMSEVLSRLDRIIALLSPAAVDEDPVEEIAEAVEEALEAVNAAEESAAPEAGVAEIIEEILDPEETLGDECEEEPKPEVIASADALRAALLAVKPALARMPRAQRDAVAGQISARLNRNAGKNPTYALLASRARARDRASDASRSLGKKIMARRNVNYRK